MKTLYRSIFLMLALAIVSCEDANETQNIGYKPSNTKDYAALRAYKQSDHEIMFGWIGGWSGGGSSVSNGLRGLPDSMDLASIWAWTDAPLTDLQREDMKYVQEVKGMKVVACLFAPKIGKYYTPKEITLQGQSAIYEYWGWDPRDVNLQEEAMRKYARVTAEELIKAGFDGIDIDNETEDGNIFGNTRLFCAYVEELGKYMGPASGTGKLLCIDGYMTAGMKREMNQYIDYYISQAYNSYGYSDLDSRFTAVLNFFGDETHDKALIAKRFIVAENFESSAVSGGSGFTERNGQRVVSSLGMAGWRPQIEGVDIPKGGTGLYHIENDYLNTKRDYYYTRKAIHIMNPVPTTPVVDAAEKE